MAIPTQILFEDPGDFRKGSYPYYGASPKFTYFLRGFLLENQARIKSVKLAFYLFNNFELHKTFLQLAKAGVKIDVVSIPLDGYDDSLPQTIETSDDGFKFKKQQTKKTIAASVYNNFVKHGYRNYKLHISNHAYIRSAKIRPFSRGEVPYSLHIKSILIEMPGGEWLLGATSSNMAMRDLPKHDFFLLKPLEEDEAGLAKGFFNKLISHSQPFGHNETNRNSFNFQFNIEKQKPLTGILFTSPFYANSPEEAENRISGLFRNAKKRIWVVAQHISSFQYSIPLSFKTGRQTNAVQYCKGCLSELIKKGQQGIDIRCLSQTYVSDYGGKGKFRTPANTYNFRKFISELKKIPTVRYAVNNDIHSKYIIVDDIVVVSTFNYTPTQFISLPYVNIEKFEHIPGLKYKGVFAEVGVMLQLSQKNEVGCFVENFKRTWDSPQSIKTI